MNILIVDDHPLTASIYSSIILQDESSLQNSHTSIAHNCQDGYNAVLEFENSNSKIDFAIIDVNLPPFEKEKIMSGGDLASFITKRFAKCKICIITSHTEVLIIYDLLRKINPLGLVSKNDITTGNLCTIIHHILGGNAYRSPQIKACIDEVWNKDFMFDDYNRKILLHLAKGYRIKDLEEIVLLSGSAIQKRVVKLKKVFDAHDERELLKKVFEQGFL
ncbi:response regulator [Flavobacterium sp. DG1-102-2]|uniref:response regulator n=1 Tax=Flavobacterium sp. DG1-102-2 TaxID=3081663 RepID=UPI0029490C1D|nr:response regulator [Flavobacterium sp. DG1-102-2]MDV6167364.1 response regulator [Flavobacterium sp. DG1-102-2]